MEVSNITDTDAKAVVEQAPAPAKAAAAAISYVTDGMGRKIGLKKLKPSERFQLAEDVQTKTPSGEMQAIFVASVISIGEEGYPPISSIKDLKRRLDDLDDEGLRAITPVLLKAYGLAIDEKDVLTAKNS